MKRCSRSTGFSWNNGSTYTCGETTKGAIDDRLRHAITQLSTLHFTLQVLSKRVIEMGHPEQLVTT